MSLADRLRALIDGVVLQDGQDGTRPEDVSIPVAELERLLGAVTCRHCGHSIPTYGRTNHAIGGDLIEHTCPNNSATAAIESSDSRSTGSEL